MKLIPVKSLTMTLVFMMLLGLSSISYAAIEFIDVTPSAPTIDDEITISVGGTMGNPCQNIASTHSIIDNIVRIDIMITPSSEVCVDPITTWSVEENIGMLRTGGYIVEARVNLGNIPVTKAFRVTGDSFPAMSLISLVNREAFTKFDNIQISGKLTNESTEAQTVDVKAWIQMPDSNILPLYEFHSVTLDPLTSIEQGLLNYFVTGGEPEGTYAIVSRILHPVTGEILEEHTQTFNIEFISIF